MTTVLWGSVESTGGFSFKGYKSRRTLGAIIEQHPLLQLTKNTTTFAMSFMLDRANSHRFVTPSQDKVTRTSGARPALDLLGKPYLSGQEVTPLSTRLLVCHLLRRV